MGLNNQTTAIAVGAVVFLVVIATVFWLLRPRKPPAPAAPPALKPEAPDPFAAGGAAEKRRAVRRRGKFVPVLIVGAGGLGSKTEGWVVDRSVAGVRLGVSREIPVGSTIKICAVGSTPPAWI